jgi:hypothetical protein
LIPRVHSCGTSSLFPGGNARRGAPPQTLQADAVRASFIEPPELMPRDPLAWLPLLRHWTHCLGEGPDATPRMGS